MALHDFRAYAGDCYLVARLELPDGKRLTDWLNEQPSLTLQDAELLAHDDGHSVRLESLELDVSEVLVVEATGDRGPPELRRHTRADRVDITVGPYRLLGYLHGPSGGDPMAMILRGNQMVPITEARIAFHHAGQAHVREVEVLIMNRSHATAVAHEGTPDSGILNQLGMAPIDPRAKDLTSELYGGPEDGGPEDGGPEDGGPEDGGPEDD